MNKLAPTAKDKSPKIDRLSQLKMLVALDALLRHGSVSLAAKELDLQVSSLSRILQSLREHFGDQLFIRTGRGLAATPFAESLRPRLRALASEADNLSSGKQPAPVADVDPSEDKSAWNQSTLIAAPPLAARSSLILDGQPTPEFIAGKLAAIGDNDEPQRRLAKYIALSSMSSGHSRPLELGEAKDAFAIILAGDADPVQIGALMTTMQYRGATATEIAGFLQALWYHIGRWPNASGNVDLDWPAYLSPRYRSAPWFMQSALLVRDAGYRILLHGYFGQGNNSGKLEAAAADCGINISQSMQDASAIIGQEGIAYLPIGAICKEFQQLLNLYPLLEMRLPLNTVMHLANPLSARCTMIGIANPSYRELHRDVMKILDLPNLTILGNMRDIAQINPVKSTPVFGRAKGRDIDLQIPAIRSCSGKHSSLFSSREFWAAIWNGAARDERVEATIISTAAAALMSLSDMNEDFETAIERASTLWAKRDKRLAAH